MRWIMGGTNITTAGTAAVIHSGDTLSRILAFQFSAPASNGAQVYIGHSSAVSSVESHILSSATRYPVDGSIFTVPAGKGLPTTSFWMNASASTTATVRFGYLLEP